MVIEKYATIRWHGNNKNHYEKLGYSCEKVGKEFIVPIKHLPIGSHHEISVMCEVCGYIRKSTYNHCISNLDGVHSCRPCANRRKKTQNLMKQILYGEVQSFAEYLISQYGKNALNLYWSIKNKSNPWLLTNNSNQKIFINCVNNKVHESYQTTANHFFNGKRCPFCDKKKVHYTDSLGFNDDMAVKLWGQMNDKTPYEYAPKSHHVVWWRCKDNRHEDYERNIYNSNNLNYKCPKCAREQTESALQRKVRLYLSDVLHYDVKHEHECSLICTNLLTKAKMPYDNEVVELKLIIEVMGLQHYSTQPYTSPSKWCDPKLTPEQQLLKRQRYDEIKKQYALSSGYNYIAIPYWTERNKSYKSMINKKIVEIQHGCRDAL